MNRRKFLGVLGGSVAGLGVGGYLLSDKSNLARSDFAAQENASELLKPDESEILYLASLAPSGHNTQPWFIQYIEPYHWIIGNDKSRWLPAVDPTQRETLLSIGAFVQNLEYAAGALGYECIWNLLAANNQDAKVMEVRLTKTGVKSAFDIEKLRTRKTSRSGFINDEIKKEDLGFVTDSEKEFIHYIPALSKEGQFINEQTIEANRIQTYRDPAQKELAEWIRFSSKDAESYRDGLTTASMEIEGIPGWLVRNFYGKENVMSDSFRQQGLDIIKKQVSESSGWLLMTSKDASTETLLETGRKMERMFLKVREKNIGLHPMTQILEEDATKQNFGQAIGIGENIQFILRIGYLKEYQKPVSLRRPVEWFVKK